MTISPRTAKARVAARTPTPSKRRQFGERKSAMSQAATNAEEQAELASRDEAIRAMIRRVPYGRVASYGQIATLVGMPRHARLVGYVLRNSCERDELPWHRIVNASGAPAFPPESASFLEQEKRLLAEQVVLLNGKVPLRQYRWEGLEEATLDQLLWAPSCF